MSKPVCKPHELLIAAERRYHHLHIAPAGTTLEQVCDPTYWSSVANEFKRAPWALIEIIADDGSWEADLRVFAIGDGFAKVRVRNSWAYADKPGRKPALPDGYKVEHLPTQGWRAMSPNGEVVAERKQVEMEAVRAAADHARTMTPAQAA